MPTLPRSPQAGRKRSKSPSYQAAQLAAARSPIIDTGGSHVARPRARTTQRPSVPPKPRRLSQYSPRFSDGEDGEAPDSSPTPPTTSLVELFERKANNSDAGNKRPEPVVIKPRTDLPIQSPKPVRTSDGGITSVFQMELEEKPATPKPAREVAAKDHAPSTQLDGQSSDEDYVSASEDAALSTPPITIRKQDSRAPSSSSTISATSTSTTERHKRPLPSPLRHATTGSFQRPNAEPRVVSQSDALSPSSQSSKSIPAQHHQLYPRKTTPLNSGDALANAIIASSLASARVPSPRKIEPPPVPTRRQKHHTQSISSRTPSPAKHGLRHTLRKTDPEESESENELHPYAKHQKKRLVRKHPNKHHEGDRKRWRDAVTDRERTRYEGVWASNKGLFCSLTPEEEQAYRQTPESKQAFAVKAAMQDQVSNIVAREIWGRSRLPDAILEAVWDLVDDDCVGRLGKEQFVVGMWLIDQRLKGRKLPVKVTESIWASVRGLQGIKIRK